MYDVTASLLITRAGRLNPEFLAVNDFKLRLHPFAGRVRDCNRTVRDLIRTQSFRKFDIKRVILRNRPRTRLEVGAVRLLIERTVTPCEK